MSAQRIAHRYAKSLLELAVEKGQLEAVFSDMKGMNELINESRDLFLMLKSPIIQTEKKAKVLKTGFEGNLHELTYAFMQLLTRKKRENIIPEISQAFVQQYNTLKKITHVDLTVAAEPDQAMMDKVLKVLKEQAGLVEIEMNTQIDPDIIGGFILRYDNKLYDDSVVSRLKEMKGPI